MKRGYPTKTARLWKGTEPTATEKLVIADECTRLQSQMLAWSRNAGSTVAPFDCTMTALIKLYQCDEGGYWSSRTQPNQLCH